MMPGSYASFLPVQTEIQHMVWSLNVDGSGNPVRDAHGIQQGSYAAPVKRFIICWWPLERRTWEIDPVDPDVVARYDPGRSVR